VPGPATDNDDRRAAGARVSQLVGRYSTALVGALLVVVGVALLAFVAKVLDLGNGAILVIAFLGPLLAYLIVTGQLSEFGAGGVSVKFREAARAPVDASVQLVTAEETQAIAKLGAEEIKRIDTLDPEAPVVLTLTLRPRSGEYVFDALRQYISQLQRHPRFRFVVFLDHGDRVVGYVRGEVLARQLETRTTAKPFLEAVNSGRLPRDRSVHTEFLTPETTTEEALSRMTTLRLDAMLMRDDQRRLTGIVERVDVLVRLMLAAARS
jgi:CBS domain